MDKPSCSQILPPPRSWAKSLLLIVLAAILLGAAPALAQTPSFDNLVINEVGSDCLWLEYEITGAITGQTAYISTDSTAVFSSTDTGSIPTGDLTYQFTGLTAETTYYIGVAGTRVGGSGELVQSDVVSATTSAAGVACGDVKPSHRLNAEVVFVGSECVWVAWYDHPDVPSFNTFARATGDSNPPTVQDNVSPPHLYTGLTANTEYTIAITPEENASQETVVVTTAAEDTACPSRAEILALLNPPEPEKPSSGSSSAGDVAAGDVAPTPRPPDNTCPNMLPAIVVSGYVMNASQCQMVAGAGVGRQDLLDRGVVSAVDIWSLVPNTGVEVCFANMGAAVVFLDAAYSPRLLSSLEYVVRDGHTCTTITTTGTVVLLAS